MLGAELDAVDLMDAGVERCAGPTGELLEIAVDDYAEPAVIARPLSHTTGRIGEAVTVICECEANTRLLQARTQSTDVGDLPQKIRKRLVGRRRTCGTGVIAGLSRPGMRRRRHSGQR